MKIMLLAFLTLTSCDPAAWARGEAVAGIGPGLDVKVAEEAEEKKPAVVLAAAKPSRAELCRFMRDGLKLPIVITQAEKDAAYAQLGKSSADRLLFPVARVNNTYRCLCLPLAQRPTAKCGS